MEMSFDNSFFFDMIEQSRQGIYIVRVIVDENKKPVDGIVEYCNDTMVRMGALSKENVIGIPYSKAFPNGNNKWLQHYYEAGFENKPFLFDEFSEEFGAYVTVRILPTGREGYCCCCLEEARGGMYRHVENLDASATEVRRLQRRSAVLDALCTEYTAVFVCDMKRDTCEIIKSSPFSHMETALREIPKEQHGIYSTLCRYFDEKVFVRESAEGFWSVLNPDALMKALEHQDTFAFRIRTVKSAAGMEYYYIKAVRLLVDETHFRIVIGAQPIDELMKREEEGRIKLENALIEANLNNEIISAVAKLNWMIYRIDLQGGIYEEVSSDENVHRLTGRRGKSTEAFDRMLSDIVSDEHREEMKKFLDISTLAERMQGKTSIAKDFFSADGHWYQSRFVANRRDSDGHLMSVLHLARNIDTQKREEFERARQVEMHAQSLQKALSELEQNTEIVMAIANEYTTVFWENLENKSYMTIAAQKPLDKIVGTQGTLADIREESLELLVAPEMRRAMRKFTDFDTLADRLQDKNSVAFEYKAPDDKWFTAEYIVKKRNDAGRVTEVLYIDKEITSDKKKELEYQEKLRLIAQDAEKANAAKSDFLRRMSHDIRTPINGIRGMIEMAESFDDDIEKQRECREKAKASTEMLLSLVNDILDMNKLESGRIVLKHDPFSLKKVLAEISAVSSAQALDLNVVYEQKMSGIRHNCLVGSATHLKQIMLNFTSNAIKFNHKGGRVILTCRETECGEQRAVFEFTCEDTGIGMSEEFQSHMFEPFTQENQGGARTTYAGTGLGMSIAKQLTELMGGSVQIESKLGQGTKATAVIPFDIDFGADAQDETDDAEFEAEGIRALLAEDNELNAEIAGFILKKMGLQVTHAANGKVALDMFKKAPDDYDVIFMDIMMPEMSGLDAAKAIRELPIAGARTIPIFAMTANAFIDDIEKSKANGMNEHLVKPLQSDDIKQVLRKYFAKRQNSTE